MPEEFMERVKSEERHSKERGVFSSLLERTKAAEHSFLVGVAILIGITGGFGAVGFRYLIKLFQGLMWGSWTMSAEVIQSTPLPWKIIIPAVGGLLCGMIVYHFAREAKGHGVPEVMEAVALRSGLIRVRVVFVKALASALSIASGGSVGREGPIVQIGSAMGSTFGQILKVGGRRLKTFVGCGAAAGIAATFNAPIAGSLFAVEIILGDFAVPQFSPIVISAVLATVVSRHFLGDTPAFEVPAYTLHSSVELLFYLVLGVLAGVAALLFIKVLYGLEDIFEKIRIYEGFKALIGGALIGTIAIFYPQICGVGYDTIGKALSGNLPIAILGVLIIAKILATGLTIGSGGSGGIFAPSLFIGSMLGGSMGYVFHHFFPEITATYGAYALVGMGAVVAGATHAPITAILIIFELTNSYTIILPLMIACIIATLLTTRAQKESIYTKKLIRRGINIFRGREVGVLKSVKVKDVAQQKPEFIPQNMKLDEIVKTVANSSGRQFFTVDEAGNVTGVITLQDLRRVLDRYEDLRDLIIAQDIAKTNVIRIFPEETIHSIMKHFLSHDLDELPVADPGNPDKLIGIVKRSDVINAYNREIFRRDMAGELAESMTNVHRFRQIEIVNGFSMLQIEAPGSFIDKTIGQLDIRWKYGVEIVLVQTRENEKEIKELVPDARYRIKRGDILVVFGENKKLEQLQRLV